MYHKIKFIPLSALLLVAVFLMLSSQVQAKATPRVEGISSQENLITQKVISVGEQEAALSFWTRDVIAAARPLPIPVQLTPDEIDQPTVGELQMTGEPGFVAPALAAPDADAIARAAYPDDWASLEEMASSPPNLSEVSGTSGVYTAYTINQWSSAQTIYPHRWVGRLSFSTSGGTNYCSGSAIAGNVMLTAAHCLYDTTSNVWFSNFVFSPAYRNGSTPYGTFAATNCYVLTSWVNLSGSYNISSWAPHDVGVCKMGNNSSGQTLNQAVGSLGRQQNQSVTRHFHNMGYPWNNYNNVPLTDAGKYLRTCVAESAQYAPEVLRMGCSYGGGISGGPWVTSYAINVVSGHANGVNSGIFIGQQNIYAGRFNSNNIVPLCNAAGC